MKVRLHAARRVLGGMILFPWGEAETVLGRYAEAIGSASNNLSVVIGIISLPDGSPALFLAPAWTGELSEGEMAIEVLQRCGKPMHAQIASMSYQDLIQGFDARVANDRHYALETRWIPALNPETISALIAGGASRTSPFSTIILQHFRGLPTQFRRTAPPLDCDANISWWRSSRVGILLPAITAQSTEAGHAISVRHWLRCRCRAAIPTFSDRMLKTKSLTLTATISQDFRP